jgi:hypothetical protein
MTGPIKLIMKTATEYRIGSPDGEVHTAETTTILQLVSLLGDHAVCEKDGRPIVVRGNPAQLDRALRSPRR